MAKLEDPTTKGIQAMATAKQFQLTNAQIDNTSTIIKNLNRDNHRVIIDTEIYSHTNDVRNFINQSPLKNNSTITDEKLLITNNLFDKNKSLKLSIGKKRHIKVELV